MRPIDADALRNAMYHEAFETDTDMQRWDSGCWIRYKMFENVLEKMPTVSPQVERKTGRWIEMGKNEDGTHNLCCGVCGEFKFKSKGHANSQYTKERYKFCGGCGAKMEVE